MAKGRAEAVSALHIPIMKLLQFCDTILRNYVYRIVWKVGVSVAEIPCRLPVRSIFGSRWEISLWRTICSKIFENFVMKDIGLQLLESVVRPWFINKNDSSQSYKKFLVSINYRRVKLPYSYPYILQVVYVWFNKNVCDFFTAIPKP